MLTCKAVLADLERRKTMLASSSLSVGTPPSTVVAEDITRRNYKALSSLVRLFRHG